MSTEHDEGQPQMDSRERQVTLTFNSTRLIPLIDSLRKPILTLRSERLKIGMDLFDNPGSELPAVQQARIKQLNSELWGLEQELCVLLENFYMHLRQDMGEPQPWPRDNRGDPGKSH